VDVTFAQPTSNGSNHSGLWDPDGASIVIHADPDDQKTDPAGNSGARIACGVVTRAR
jgi:Cu-Zn family superoxide dismutase